VIPFVILVSSFVILQPSLPAFLLSLEALLLLFFFADKTY